ncbi:MAG: protein kinase [Verrucomicrobiia bacterium]
MKTKRSSDSVSRSGQPPPSDELPVPPHNPAPLFRPVPALPAVSTLGAGGSGNGGISAGRGPAVTLLGDYELVEEIGRGGMGVVFKARQMPLKRYVAVKLIRASGLATESELRRFKLEAETAAALDHPNIVPIYEVGEFEGLPFFSMRLIEGASLAKNRQPFEEDQRAAARMLAALARTVHHAHERGVLHRDIKPSNVLIDATGQPHLTDFGLAKRLRGDGDLSLSGAVIGTPNYMSPEQAAGKKAEITTAADIYSLGAVLYEILTGRPPFQADTHTATLQRVIEGDCRRPRLLRSDIDRDLETITLKCLEKDPHRRYGNAEALAEDLERWLRHEPIEASPSSRWDRAVKWARRRPAVAALFGVTLGAVVVILALIVSNQQRLTHQRNIAVQNALAATEARQIAERQRYAAVIRVAAASVDNGKLAGVGAMLDACAPDLRGWEWGYLRKHVPPPVWSVKAHARPVAAIALSPDQSQLASAGEDGLLRVSDAATGKELGNWPCGWQFRNSLAFTPDGQAVLACSPHGLLKLDLASGQSKELSSRDTMSFCLDPTGRFCCLAWRGGLETYELATWTRISEISLPEDAGRGVATDGRLILTATENPELPVFLLALTAEGQLRPRGRFYRSIGAFRSAVFEPANHRVALACSRTLDLLTIPAWLTGWQPPLSIPAAEGKWTAWPKLSLEVQNAREASGFPTSVLAIEKEDGWVLSGCVAGEVRAFRSSDASLAVTLPYDARVTALAVSSNRIVFAGLSDGVIRADRLAPPDPVDIEVAPGATAEYGHIAIDSSGRSVLGKTSGLPGILLWCITNAGGWIYSLPASDTGVTGFRPGTDEIAVACPGAVRFYRPESGKLRLARELATRGFPDRVVFDRGGSLLAVSYGPRNGEGIGADVYPVGSEGERRRIPLLESKRDQRLIIDLSPDGSTLAILTPANKQLELSGTDAGRPWHRALSEDFEGDGVLQFHPFRRVLACAAADHSISIWDLDEGRVSASLKGHADSVTSIEFSPDGRRLVSSGLDHTVRVWDWEVSEPLLVLPHGDIPYCARFSPDGLALVCSGIAPAVRTRLALPWAQGTSGPQNPSLQ